MGHFTVDGLKIPYKITYKRNKYTHIYLKKDYIQINTARRTTKQDVLDILKQHEDKIWSHYHKIKQNKVDPTRYMLFGKPYQKVQTDLVEKITINHDLERVLEPVLPTDQLSIHYKRFEKETLLKQIQQYHEKYKNNPIISLEGVRYFTRYTTTRHGSCNKQLRRINFNTHLVHFPKECIEYVYVHEIVHLLHAHHQKAFYDTLRLLFPKYKIIQKQLKEQPRY